jgi:hypothetical protein
MTTGDDQPTQRVPPGPGPTPVRPQAPAAGPWTPGSDPGPDDQLTQQVSLPPQAMPTLPVADAQRMLSETVAIRPNAPETVVISPKAAPPHPFPQPPAADATQTTDISDQPTWRVTDAPPGNVPTRRFAETRGPGSVFDQPTAYQPPVGQPVGEPTGQVTLYPRTNARSAPAPTRAFTGPAPGEVLRFGPGVPRAEPDMSRAASIWRGEQQSAPNADKPRRGRGLVRWLLPLVVLLAVLAVLLWRYSGSSIAVTGVSIRAGQQALGCDGTEKLTGVLDTNGDEGTVTYRWQRSDGTFSNTLQQHVAKGTHQSEVTLLWTFDGKGAVHATATLEVLSPGSSSASADFTYSCR